VKSRVESNMSKHLGDRLIDYAWESLTTQERAQADAHLQECADCRTELGRHQTLVSRVAATIPTMLPAVPSRVQAGWPAIAARIPRLRTSSAATRRGSPGLVAVGLAVSIAILLAVTVTVQAWLELGRPPLTATAFYTSSTPTASATHTPERPPVIATPVVSLLQAAPVQAPTPLAVAVTARP